MMAYYSARFWNTNSVIQFSKHSWELKIGLQIRVVWEIGGKIRVFDKYGEGDNFWLKLLGG